MKIRKVRTAPRRKGHPLPVAVARGNQADGKAFEEEAIEQERISFRVHGRIATRALYAARFAGRQPLLDGLSISLGAEWSPGNPTGTLRLISCKTGPYIRPRERQALAEFLKRLPSLLRPHLEVHYRGDDGKIHRTRIENARDLDRFAHRKGVHDGD